MPPGLDPTLPYCPGATVESHRLEAWWPHGPWIPLPVGKPAGVLRSSLTSPVCPPGDASAAVILLPRALLCPLGVPLLWGEQPVWKASWCDSERHVLWVLGMAVPSSVQHALTLCPIPPVVPVSPVYELLAVPITPFPHTRDACGRIRPGSVQARDPSATSSKRGITQGTLGNDAQEYTVPGVGSVPWSQDRVQGTRRKLKGGAGRGDMAVWVPSGLDHYHAGLSAAYGSLGL